MADQSILCYVVSFLNYLDRIYLFLDNPEGLDTKVEIFDPVLPTHFQLVVLKQETIFYLSSIMVDSQILSLLSSTGGRHLLPLLNGLVSQFKNVCTCVVHLELKSSTSNGPTR